ncbi:2,3-bisphosphoglycerate-independent phosphoglycerate mutase [Bacteroidales bacterium AH-315-I05]|nr:2,3-bisphosphoglycerate-independent phosphoglycerate mutase [Bacteroidales bacterium AH-315-I05]
MSSNKKVVLMILDGWGYGDKSKSDAIHHANTPFVDSLYEKHPHSQLLTDGENVGLPSGQMGNSEVGHLNIGAGRIVYQDLVKINRAIESNELAQNPTLLNAFRYAKENNKPLHLIGLVSDGGVHSSQDHLHTLCDLAKENGIEKVFIHAFTDGRDTDPKSGKGYIEKLENHLKLHLEKEISRKDGGLKRAELASVVGRYYAMDRDKRWERVKIAYDLLVNGKGNPSNDMLQSMQQSYDNGITDEFIKPIVKVDENGNHVGRINKGDAVLCFNFRTDRCREITMALTQQNFPEYAMEIIPLHYVTMTNYNSLFQNVHVIFEKDNLQMTMGEVLAKADKKQTRISETEKYPHVTFFFSGGREDAFEGEKRILINSPKIATYDLQPEMSAYEVTDAICTELEKQEPDFICLNFANPDMVGHTGVYEAVTKALEAVDSCVKRVVETGVENGYSFLIIADHGNADYVINEDNSPNTAHTTNPVPCILIDNNFNKIKDGILADVAPTLLTMLGMEIPGEMTGKVLVG